jgi:hypothetical protein
MVIDENFNVTMEKVDLEAVAGEITAEIAFK